MFIMNCALEVVAAGENKIITLPEAQANFSGGVSGLRLFSHSLPKSIMMPRISGEKCARIVFMEYFLQSSLRVCLLHSHPEIHIQRVHKQAFLPDEVYGYPGNFPKPGLGVHPML